MKILKISLLLTVVLLVSHNSISNSPIKKEWSKNVWREIEANVDSTLFLATFNRNSYEWEAFGADEFDLEKYNIYYKSCSKNLWNLIHKNIIDDNLQLYAPYNPVWIDEIDDGLFRFPLVSDDSLKNTDFITNMEWRTKLLSWQLLGYEQIGMPEVMHSVTDPDYDSIDVDGSTVYYPFPIIWYNESDIIKYRLIEECVYDKNSVLKDRIITGIAPVTHKRNFNGEVVGEQVLFWVKFEDLKTILKAQYLLVDYGMKPKTMSYYKYFVNRLFSSKIVKEETLYMNKVKE